MKSTIKLLLVDDEKHLLLTLSDRLISEGFEVVTASSGENALAILEETNPNLVILDISMPGMGGVGFLRRISNPDGSTTYPVLVLTARGNMKDFFESIQVDGFLGKPCDEEELIAKIHDIVGKHQQTNEKAARTKKRILFAEDDETRISPIRNALQNAGYEVIHTHDGPSVLDQCVSVKPDLILLKEILSGLNGSAVTSMLKVMPSARDTPVIIYDETRDSSAPQPSGLDGLQNLKAFLHTANPQQLSNAVKQTIQKL
jgi:DNA-binding response OmpR family regulator